MGAEFIQLHSTALKKLQPSCSTAYVQGAIENIHILNITHNPKKNNRKEKYERLKK